MDWTLLSAPALVDWCEPNHVVSPAVAEWWNTLSSVGMTVVGVGAAWAYRRAELRFRLGLWGLAAVGLGSAAFHGTLLRVAQAADELPMVWLGLACVWALADRARAPGAGRGLARGLAAFGVVFCGAYFTVPWAFALFLAVYGGMVAWVALRTLQLTWWRPARDGEASQRLRRLGAATVVAYLGSFFGFWVPEHALLGCDHPLQALQLHSFWHLGAGVGTAAWWAWAHADRALARGAVDAPGARVALGG